MIQVKIYGTVAEDFNWWLGIGRFKVELVRGVEIRIYSVRACDTGWLSGGKHIDLVELL